MSPGPDPGGTEKPVHTQGWVTAWVLCQDCGTLPDGSSKALGGAGSWEVCNAPLPQSCRVERGLRGWGTLSTHRERETA